MPAREGGKLSIPCCSTYQIQSQVFQGQIHHIVGVETGEWVWVDEGRGCIIANDDVFAGWVKSHPKAIELNNKPLLHWEGLCVIFGVDQAIGADAV
ncbi:hypothetical protein LINPERHAP2_LOCUS25540 [Linum perenne]